MVFVFQQRKIEFSRECPLLELFHQLLGIVMRINADRQDLNLILTILFQKTFQLPELRSAVWSPMAAIKNKDYILLATEVRKRDPAPVHIF